MSLGTESGETQPVLGAREPEQDSVSTPNADLFASLTGLDANRERVLAHRTRRVVQGSLGLIREQKQDGSRTRAVALAITVVILLLMAPLLWEATDSLVAGEHLGDPGNQWSLWACIVCPTLLGAALVAGWWRHRS